MSQPARFLVLAWLGTAAMSLVLLPSGATADVAVIANRIPRRVPLQVTLQKTTPWQVTLSPGESRPIFCDQPVEIAFDSRAGVLSYKLETSAAYFIGSKQDGTIDLQQIGLGETPSSLMSKNLPGSAAMTPAATIPVKILVDDEELTRQFVWEPRLRKRVEAASEILHRHAMVKLEVVAVDRWVTDNTVHNFNQALTEFEQAVDPGPAELAIGFSSQYQAITGRVHLGGTHGPLRPHILIREWSQHVSENEKLELLVHELGHYLGAGHSPEPDSVMRPVLGDRQSRRTGFVVRFDPVNTLVISMVGEEIRRRRVSRFAHISDGTKLRLNQIYNVLGEATPADVAPRVLTGQLGRPRNSDPLVEATRHVLAQLSQAARDRREQLKVLGGEQLPEGDDLFNTYVRVAASAASEAPEALRPKAFLLGLGVGVGDPEMLKNVPAVRSLLARIESPVERSVRTTALGKPTIQGRHDLARHFTVAAMLVAASGKELAETASVAKEVLDAQGGSGFSFADLAADKAGIRLAEELLAGRITLDSLARTFRAEKFVPEVADLPEGLSTLQFLDQFGGANDERYQQVIREIDEAIGALPAYR